MRAAALLSLLALAGALPAQEFLEDLFPTKGQALTREGRSRLKILLDRFGLGSPFERFDAREELRGYGGAALALLEPAALSRNSGKALGAVLTLDEAPGERVDRVLAQVLTDPEAQEPVRMGAALVLGWRGGAEATAALERAWTLKRTDRLTIALSLALARVGTGAPGLLRELSLPDEPPDRVQGALALAAGFLGGPAPPPRLLALAKRKEEQLRSPAALALGGYPLDGTRALLVGLLQDPDARVRSQAALSLGAVEGREITEALLKLLEDPEEAPRAAATAALGWRTDQRLPAALLTRLGQDRSDLVRLRAVGALVAFTDKASTQALAKAALEDRASRVRARAVLSLAAGERALPAGVFEKAVQDPDPSVADVAWLALARAGPEELARREATLPSRARARDRKGPNASLVDQARRGRIAWREVDAAFERTTLEPSRAWVRARAAESLYHQYLGLTGQFQVPARRGDVPIGPSPFPFIPERLTSELGPDREDLKMWLEDRAYLGGAPR